jgi:hypothetical protein
MAGGQSNHPHFANNHHIVRFFKKSVVDPVAM